MQREIRFWRATAIGALMVLAFVIGRGATPAAEARSLLLNASHIGTNEAGDVLWVYDYDGPNKQWTIVKIDAEKGTVDAHTIDHPRNTTTY